MPSVRAGHHGDVLWVFEDAGFNAEPTDTTPKTFGSNATMDTFEASHEAMRAYNASRTAAEIVAQNFDGAWGVTFDLSTPPWWLAGVFGQPSASEVTSPLYDYTYDLANGNDPVPLRLYGPTDGFNEYKVVPGCWIVSVSVDQGPDGTPEVSLSGGYASEPETQSSPSISVPSLPEDTVQNRDAEVTVDGSTLGKAQNTSLSLETGTEGVTEIGSENAVDFTPRAFEPSITYDHILWTSQTVDLLNRFKTGGEVNVVLKYDNGETGSDEYSLDWTATGSFPNQWSESGRNDPEADLMEELQDMARDADVVVTTSAGDSGSPPGITL